MSYHRLEVRCGVENSIVLKKARLRTVLNHTWYDNGLLYVYKRFLHKSSHSSYEEGGGGLSVWKMLFLECFLRRSGVSSIATGFFICHQKLMDILPIHQFL